MAEWVLQSDQYKQGYMDGLYGRSYKYNVLWCMHGTQDDYDKGYKDGQKDRFKVNVDGQV